MGAIRIKALGHVVLYVTHLDRSITFYRDILGFPCIAAHPHFAVFSTGATHHELLLIHIGGQPIQKPGIPRPGLYHIGLKVADSDEELRIVRDALNAAHVPIIGTADHTVTHSIYITDPDGNEIELYADISDIWHTDPHAIISPTKPLSL